MTKTLGMLHPVLMAGCRCPIFPQILAKCSTRIAQQLRFFNRCLSLTTFSPLRVLDDESESGNGNIYRTRKQEHCAKNSASIPNKYKNMFSQDLRLILFVFVIVLVDVVIIGRGLTKKCNTRQENL